MPGERDDNHVVCARGSQGAEWRLKLQCASRLRLPADVRSGLRSYEVEPVMPSPDPTTEAVAAGETCNGRLRTLNPRTTTFQLCPDATLQLCSYRFNVDNYDYVKYEIEPKT